ncbi:MAG: hypothetical protein JW742_01125 [Candidatus Aminicenantes bacterium]|nr:hypothetical protein [Candidatus Aminicenantes bacterium]
MKIRGMLFLLGLGCVALISGGPSAGPASGLDLGAVGGGTPLSFIANAGQADGRALYYARTPGCTLWLAREEMVFDRIERGAPGEARRSVSRLVFKNARRDVRVSASDPLDYTVSYFFGRDESEWTTGIPTSRAVVYDDLYDGIDLRVYGTDRQVEYDWIVGRGGRPEDIRFDVAGGPEASIDRDGNIAVGTDAGRIVHRKPAAYQVIGGRRVSVEAAFRKAPDGSFGFSLGVYDHRCDLVIDPLVIVYGTLLGGWKEDYGIRAATDRLGALYVSGITFSGDFPPEMGTQPRMDCFVTKLSPDGASLIYTAFFPSASDWMNWASLDVDAKGFAYLAGVTRSSSFPVKNAFQPKSGGGFDGFILKLSRDGRSLLYSSYIGGSSEDACYAVRADASGAAYLVGYTYSRDFPRKKALQPAFGGLMDGFVAKVDPSGSSLVYATCLGGNNYDSAYALQVAADGGLVVGGATSSANFPRRAAFQKSYGGGYEDGFVAKLAPAGNALVFSSFLGGGGSDLVSSLALDAGGAIYVSGDSSGTFPVRNAFQKVRGGGRDAVVAKIDAKGRSIVYASYLGGAGQEISYGIAVDANGAVCLSGFTTSRNFPVKKPYQRSQRGSQDCFLAVVDPAGSLSFSTYLGGKYREASFGITAGADGALILTGATKSPDFPLPGAYQAELGGDVDAFILKFTLKPFFAPDAGARPSFR